MYEDEGSSRRAVGSVEGISGTWWSAELVVSMTDNEHALLTIQRHGADSTCETRGASTELTLPVADLNAFAALIPGIIAQAHRDGVLLPGNKENHLGSCCRAP
jgi:hypothetical protein